VRVSQFAQKAICEFIAYRRIKPICEFIAYRRIKPICEFIAYRRIKPICEYITYRRIKPICEFIAYRCIKPICEFIEYRRMKSRGELIANLSGKSAFGSDRIKRLSHFREEQKTWKAFASNALSATNCLTFLCCCPPRYLCCLRSLNVDIESCDAFQPMPVRSGSKTSLFILQTNKLIGPIILSAAFLATDCLCTIRNRHNPFNELRASFSASSASASSCCASAPVSVRI
jgi:hypothetical protein